MCQFHVDPWKFTGSCTIYAISHYILNLVYGPQTPFKGHLVLKVVADRMMRRRSRDNTCWRFLGENSGVAAVWSPTTFAAQVDAES